MKRSTAPGFTLIEMLTVMTIIAILTALVIAIAGYAQRRSAETKAQGQIASMAAALESYKQDNGSYPRDSSRTDGIDPRVNGNPSSSTYLTANIFLYKALSGDTGPGSTPIVPPQPDAVPDGKPESTPYYNFPASMLKTASTGAVSYIVDPFGNPFGYSTAGAAFEENFRIQLQSNPSATRGTPAGFNPTFDLWSTAGVSTSSSDTAKLIEDRKRWIKNWTQ